MDKRSFIKEAAKVAFMDELRKIAAYGDEEDEDFMAVVDQAADEIAERMMNPASQNGNANNVYKFAPQNTQMPLMDNPNPADRLEPGEDYWGRDQN